MPSYVVKAGESAGSLYRREYGDYEAFVRYIGKIKPGQVINLPNAPLAAKVRAAPAASTGATSSGILTQLAPTIAPLLPAVEALQNLGAGMTRFAVNPPTFPQIIQPFLAGAQTALGDINRFFDPARKSLGLGAPGASKVQPSPAPFGVSFGRDIKLPQYGGSQAAQNAYAQRYTNYAAAGRQLAPYNTPASAQRGRPIFGSPPATGAVGQGQTAAQQLTQGQWGDAARYSAQAIDYAIRNNKRDILPAVNPTLQAFMGYTDEQMIAFGYLPNPNGYWEPWKFGPPSGGGGGGGGGGRGFGGRGGGVSPSPGFSYGLVNWRI